jgi:CRP-like cAMP-binding protein
VKDEFLKFAPLFTGLSESERQAVSGSFAEESSTAGSTLFSAGEAADRLFLLGAGFVRITTEAGQVLATLGPGSVLGETALFSGGKHDVSATAVSPVEYWALSDSSLRALVLEQPQMGIKLGRNAGAQIVQMEAYLTHRLSRIPELQALPPHTQQAVAQHLEPRTLAEGEVLYRAGQAPAGIYLLESGAMELQPEAGAEGLGVRRLAPGALLGALALITNKPVTEQAMAVEESQLWLMSAENFHAVNSRHPGLRRSLGRALVAPLSVADQAQAVTRLQQMPLFASVPAGVVQSLAQRMTLRHVPAGDRLYRVGEVGDAFYVVESGEIELTAENESGVIEEKARIGGGSFFGEVSLLTGQIRAEDATATRNSNLWVLPKQALDLIAAEQPALAKALSQAVATRLAATTAPALDESRFRSFELLAGLSAGELRAVAEVLHPTRFRAGEPIFRMNSPADTLFLIERGQVRIQPISGGSYLLGPGDEFGERALLSNQPHNAAASAESDVDVWTLNKTDFALLMSKQPALAINLSRILSMRTGQPAPGAQPAGGSRPPGAEAGPAPAPGAPPFMRPGQQPLAGQGAAPRGSAQPGGAQYSGPQYSGAQQSWQGAPAATQGWEDDRNRAPVQEYMGYDEYAPEPVQQPTTRRGIGGWFGALNIGGKILTIVIAALVLYVLFLAVPWAILRLLDLAGGTPTTVQAAAPEALSAAARMGSYNLAEQDADLAAALVAADAAAGPAPTFTPAPTPTPAGGAPEVASKVVAMALPPQGIEYTTDLVGSAGPATTGQAIAAAFAEPAPEAAAPEAAAAPAAAAPAAPRTLDPRLPALGVTIDDAPAQPGEQYWRLIEVRFADEQESGGKHHIYVDLLDENGNRIVGQNVSVLWGDGSYTGPTEEKPAPDFGFNYQMYAAGYAYNVRVEGLPSDLLKGAGMGDVENRFYGIHTSYYLTYQKATR